jgi:hypothetical protein
MKQLGSNIKRIAEKAAFVAGLSLVSLSAFAVNSDDSSMGSLTSFETNVTTNAAAIFKIVMIVATLAGLVLIIKGLVHLKQNYTGSGQEKHLSKGVASLLIGVALILAIPISHMLTTSVDASTSFNAGAGTISFS